MSNNSYRRFTWTLNNYTDDEINHIHTLYNTGVISYCIFGKEVAPTTGTPHLQGYWEMVKKTREKAVHKLLPRAHFEPSRGTAQQNQRYCSEDGNVTEIGSKKKQGKRNDLDEIRTLAKKEGMRAVTRVGNLQQIRVSEKYLEYNEKKRNWLTEVIWIWGDSGTGKSKMAREITEDPYTKNEGSKWWIGYDKHEHVIIDDFRDSWWPITEFLRILDRYECKLETKGGSRQLLAKKIVITTIKKPEEHYKNAPGEPLKQLTRRITQVIHLVPEVTVPEVGGNTTGLSSSTDPPDPDSLDNVKIWDNIDEIIEKIN